MKPFGFLLAAALLGSACASAVAGRQGVAHPSGRDDLILRIDLEGGFVPPSVLLGRLPVLALYGDGRLIVQGPQIEIYPGPALPNLQVRTISEGGIQAILAAAERAGLLGPDHHYDDMRVSDMPTTTFTVVADGGRHVVSVYALGMQPEEGPDADAIAKIAAFQAKMTDLSSWLPAGSLGPEESFRTDELRVYVSAYVPQEELPQQLKNWPGGTFAGFQPVANLADFRCGTVSGSGLSAALAAAQTANQLTPWRADGRSWALLFRPLLPEESGCAPPVLS